MPRLFRQLRLRIRSLFRRKRVEEELDEELQYHLERQILEDLAAGLAQEEARYSALRSLSTYQSKEECRDMRGMPRIEDLDAGSPLWRSYATPEPGSLVSLPCSRWRWASANAIMFSVAFGLLLRPLPYANADRVAMVYMNYAARDFTYGTLCIRDYLTWKENNHAFEDPAIYRTLRMDIGGKEDVPQQIQGASVTAGYFSTLAVPPLIGRTFLAGDDQPAAGSFAVLSESIWRRRFARNGAVLGRTILVNGAPATVIGVMPDGFQLPTRDTEVWTNQLVLPPTRYGPWLYRGIARLKPGRHSSRPTRS